MQSSALGDDSRLYQTVNEEQRTTSFCERDGGGEVKMNDVFSIFSWSVVFDRMTDADPLTIDRA